MKKIFFVFVAALLAHRAIADSRIAPDGFAVERIFHSGQWEMTFNSGPMFSPFVASAHRPAVNYVHGGLQFGLMLGDLNSAGPMRGNWEFVPEVFGAGIFQGQGSYVAGSMLWLRYNFVPASWRVLPYAQAGGGFVFTDVDHRLVGQPFNFNLDLGFGLRWLLARNWSLNMEYRYQHISNADLARTNVGINAHGPMLGVSYFF